MLVYGAKKCAPIQGRRALSARQARTTLTTFTITCRAFSPLFAKRRGLVLVYTPSKHDVDQMLVQCWPTVCNAGPASNQHWFNASCLQTQNICIPFVQCVEDVGPALYKCYTNVSCLLGIAAGLAAITSRHRPNVC